MTIPGKPKADRFDSISQLGLSLHPVGAFSHGSIVDLLVCGGGVLKLELRKQA